MTTKVMVTIAVKRDTGDWSKDKTLTLAGRDDEYVYTGWVKWFPEMLANAMSKSQEVDIEEPDVIE